MSWLMAEKVPWGPLKSNNRESTDPGLNISTPAASYLHESLEFQMHVLYEYGRAGAAHA
jgi:hypothetical protein